MTDPSTLPNARQALLALVDLHRTTPWLEDVWVPAYKPRALVYTLGELGIQAHVVRRDVHWWDGSNARAAVVGVAHAISLDPHLHPDSLVDLDGNQGACAIEHAYETIKACNKCEWDAPWAVDYEVRPLASFRDLGADSLVSRATMNFVIEQGLVHIHAVLLEQATPVPPSRPARRF